LLLTQYNSFQTLGIPNILNGTIFPIIDFESDLDKINVLNETLVEYFYTEGLEPDKLFMLLKENGHLKKRAGKKKTGDEAIKNLQKYISKIPADSKWSLLRSLHYRFGDDRLKELITLLDKIDENLIYDVVAIKRDPAENTPEDEDDNES